MPRPVCLSAPSQSAHVIRGGGVRLARGLLCAAPWLSRGCRVCPGHPAAAPRTLSAHPCLSPHQNNASKLLLAIMESRHDSENAERILYNMRPKELVSGAASPPGVPWGRSRGQLPGASGAVPEGGQG